MSVFTEDELAYMHTGLLARVATIGKDDTLHIAPVGMWSHNPEFDAIDVTGFDFDHTKKFRDVARNGRATIAVDDMVKLDPRSANRAVGTRGPAGSRSEAVPRRSPTPNR